MTNVFDYKVKDTPNDEKKSQVRNFLVHSDLLSVFIPNPGGYRNKLSHSIFFVLTCQDLETQIQLNLAILNLQRADLMVFGSYQR